MAGGNFAKLKISDIDLGKCIREFPCLYPNAHLESSQAYMMEHFNENDLRFLAIFAKKLHLWIIRLYQCIIKEILPKIVGKK